MTVSKRARYEVLRRDNHTCRYCGGKAPDVALTVDHVTPVALGGTDGPGNLVAACRDCNAGKAASHPDAATIADVSDDAVRCAAAIRVAADAMVNDHRDRWYRHERFLAVWEDTPCSAWTAPTLPENWRTSVDAWTAAGLPEAVMHEAVRSAFARTHVGPHSKFRYAAGICWSKVTVLQAAAKALLDA
jgi:hypothetical protein